MTHCDDDFVGGIYYVVYTCTHFPLPIGYWFIWLLTNRLTTHGNLYIGGHQLNKSSTHIHTRRACDSLTNIYHTAKPHAMPCHAIPADVSYRWCPFGEADGIVGLFVQEKPCIYVWTKIQISGLLVVWFCICFPIIYRILRDSSADSLHR